MSDVQDSAADPIQPPETASDDARPGYARMFSWNSGAAKPVQSLAAYTFNEEASQLVFQPVPHVRFRGVGGITYSLIFFFGFWYWTLFRILGSSGLSIFNTFKAQPQILLFFAAPIAIVGPQFHRVFRRPPHLPTVTIDRTTKRLSIDGGAQGDQGVVTAVQVRSFPLAAATECRLSVVLADGSKTRLLESLDSEGTFDIAEKIADDLGVAVTTK